MRKTSNRKDYFKLKRRFRIMTYSFAIVVIILFSVIILLKNGKSLPRVSSDRIPYSLSGFYETEQLFYKQSNKKKTVLVAGINNEKAEYIVLFVIDNQHKKVTPIHIKRNTLCNYYNLDANGKIIGSITDQIKLSYSNKSDPFMALANLKDATSLLLCNTRIDYYFSMNFDAIEKLSRVIGDINITLKDDCTYIDPSYKAGTEVTVSPSNVKALILGDEYKESAETIEQRQNDYLSTLYLECSKRKDDQYVKNIFEEIAENSLFSSNDFVNLANEIFGYQKQQRIELEGSLENSTFVPDKDFTEKVCIDLIYN